MEIEKQKEHAEACQCQTIYIKVEDGRVKAVYASHTLAQADVVILDLDDAKVSDDAALESVRQSIAEAEKRCKQIY